MFLSLLLYTTFCQLSARRVTKEAGGTSKFQARGWAVGALSYFFWSRVLTQSRDGPPSPDGSSPQTQLYINIVHHRRRESTDSWEKRDANLRTDAEMDHRRMVRVHGLERRERGDSLRTDAEMDHRRMARVYGLERGKG